jgi:hypothetical protein
VIDAVTHIEQSYISSASCILANMAMKTGRTLAWDEPARAIVRRSLKHAILWPS